MQAGAQRNAPTALSPSSRRAWIEMLLYQSSCLLRMVALLAEGVDRNQQGLTDVTTQDTSPSSRRAWIEILTWTR